MRRKQRRALAGGPKPDHELLDPNSSALAIKTTLTGVFIRGHALRLQELYQKVIEISRTYHRRRLSD